MRQPLTPKELLSLLRPLGSSYLKSPLAIAVSGGVDSLALSYLIHLLRRSGDIQAPVHTFTVDHSFRRGSAEEARAVSTLLKKWGFEAEVLTLDWEAAGGIRKATFEADARALRYRAFLGKCVEYGVLGLMTAHHKGDQAETVLMRMMNGSGESGLAGMSPVAKVPESWGVYGADKVRLLRPLLGVDKNRLVDTCIGNNIQWWEDKTNADPTLTKRNNIRHQLAHPEKLPPEHQPEALLSLADRVREKVAKEEEDAFRAIEHLDVIVNTVLCRARIRVDGKLAEKIPAPVLVRAITKIASIVSPNPTLSLESMRTAVCRLLPSEKMQKELGLEEMPILGNRFTAAGLQWVHKGVADAPGVHYWELARQNYVSERNVTHTELSRERYNIEHPAGPDWTDWILWDGRFWLKIGPREDDILLRPLRPGDFSRKKVQDGVSPQEVTRNLLVREGLEGKGVKHEQRISLPAVVRKDDGRVLAVPVLGLEWKGKGEKGLGFKWEMRGEKDVEEEVRRRVKWDRGLVWPPEQPGMGNARKKSQDRYRKRLRTNN